ncbi:MAG: nucleotidyl transferase AbiEii/AbiGii toxin family protein [Candidatus Methanomethyliaceae archaeon]
MAVALRSFPWTWAQVISWLGRLNISPLRRFWISPTSNRSGSRPITVSQQIAEKVHALTRPYATGGSSRVKDAVDILLLAGQSHLRKEDLFRALVVTFDVRRTHPLPVCFPDLPKDWQRSLREEAERTGLVGITLEEADQRLKAFLDPVLDRRSRRSTWNPVRWEWD